MSEDMAQRRLTLQTILEVCEIRNKTSVLHEPSRVIKQLVEEVLRNSTKKGKSGSSQRDLSVIMPNGQCIEVKCDIKSKTRDVFGLVVAHANLVEHFYFGLAFIDVQLLLQRGQHTAAESHSPGTKRAPAACHVSQMRKDNYAAVSMATPLSVNVKDYSFVADVNDHCKGQGGPANTDVKPNLKTMQALEKEEAEIYFSPAQTGKMIVSEEELSSLSVVNPLRNGLYSGSSLSVLIQILQQQLDQQQPHKEFMALEHLKPFDNCLVGKALENRDKNRYRDILPYDKTQVPVGEDQDYINASYIKMSVGPKEYCYISSQGPLPGTTDVFWQMVWENKSDVIAMMTQEVEHGKVKCHKYWPDQQNKPMETNKYQLILDNYQIQDYFQIKIIRMIEKESGNTHVVKHLKFTTWPDHGTPRSSEHLVRFIRYMRSVQRSGPGIVHCSAGIGRSGVLICIDVILSLIEKDFDDQYQFCYKVLVEVLQGILELHEYPVLIDTNKNCIQSSADCQSMQKQAKQAITGQELQHYGC
ncbi:UNVERIFIED_CONTAM: hypothetical protein FKN15_021259 [Acipenser sinensis]